MSQPLVPPPPRARLDRVLGPWMATAVIIGTVIGSGVFKKPSTVAGFLPESGLALAAWIVMGILILMGALALAEVAVLLPRAGGNYVFLREAYGRWAGFLWGWVEFWIIRAASIGALAFIFVESLHDIIRETQGLSASQQALTFWQQQFLIVGVIAFLAIINARGTVLGAGLQVVITTVKVASLVTIALLPFLMVMLATPRSEAVNFENLAPAWPEDWRTVNLSDFGGALVAVFWAYHGWMNIAPVAEEVQNPRRNIPLALLVGTTTIMILYVAANFAYYLAIPGFTMRAITDRPVAAEFGLRLLGPIGLMLVSAAIMTSVFGALNGNMLVGPRLLFAMGRDRLAPPFLAELHARWRTPIAAIAVLAGWAMLLVVAVALLKQYRVPAIDVAGYALDLNLKPEANSFDVLTNYAMFGALAFETLAVAAIFVLRGRQPLGGETPYRCPLYPVLPLIFVVAMTAILINMFVTSRTEAVAAVGFIAAGAAFYALILAGRKTPPRDVAMDAANTDS
ncbi:MAG: amino acid permease [Gemmataceae bacterium]|nr:amino acid permease [Gemmataceae bacterium]